MSTRKEATRMYNEGCRAHPSRGIYKGNEYVGSSNSKKLNWWKHLDWYRAWDELTILEEEHNPKPRKGAKALVAKKLPSDIRALWDIVSVNGGAITLEYRGFTSLTGIPMRVLQKLSEAFKTENISFDKRGVDTSFTPNAWFVEVIKISDAVL